MIQLNDVRFNGLSPLKNMNIEKIIERLEKACGCLNGSMIDNSTPRQQFESLLKDLKQVKANSVLGDVSNCDSDTKDLIEHTKRVLDLIKPESGVAVKVLSNRVNKKIDQLK